MNLRKVVGVGLIGLVVVSILASISLAGDIADTRRIIPILGDSPEIAAIAKDATAIIHANDPIAITGSIEELGPIAIRSRIIPAGEIDHPIGIAGDILGIDRIIEALPLSIEIIREINFKRISPIAIDASINMGDIAQRTNIERSIL